MRVLVTGANGFVGQILCDELFRRKIDFNPVVRSPNARYPQAFVCGDLNGATDWHEALQGVDAVIHLAARVHVMSDTAQDPLAEFRRVNTQATLHLARCAAKQGVKRFIFLSSIKVNGEATLPDQPFTEAIVAPPTDPYGLSKWEAEQGLFELAKTSSMEVVVVRPPLIYGPGVKGNFISLLRAVDRGLPLPLAKIANRRSLLYVGNLVDVLINCCDHPAAAGQVFLVADDKPVSTSQLLTEMAGALGRRNPAWSCPTAVLVCGASVLGKRAAIQRLLGSLEIDASHVHSRLGWRAPYSLQQGMQETAAWYRRA